MLPTGFAGTLGDPPGLVRAIESIDAWCAEHRQLPILDPRQIAHEVRIPAEDLTKALFFLVDKGLLRQVYQFQTPAGYLLADDFESFLDVPDELEDRYGETVQREDGEVVPVFRGDR